MTCGMTGLLQLGTLFDHFLDDWRRRARVGPTDVEGEMTEHLAGLLLRQSVIHRPVQVIGDLSHLSGRDESAHGGEAPVSRRQAGSQPEIPEEHVGRVLDEAWWHLAELLSDTRGPLLRAEAAVPTPVGADRPRYCGS